MVTVGDLIKELDKYDRDIPVFWGIDEMPCWLAKKDKDISDFPMVIETVRTDSKNPNKVITYLYFGDYNDIDRVRKEEVAPIRDKYYSIPRWIRRIFNR